MMTDVLRIATIAFAVLAAPLASAFAADPAATWLTEESACRYWSA
jgi:hypothetical protein